MKSVTVGSVFSVNVSHRYLYRYLFLLESIYVYFTRNLHRYRTAKSGGGEVVYFRISLSGGAQ